MPNPPPALPPLDDELLHTLLTRVEEAEAQLAEQDAHLHDFLLATLLDELDAHLGGAEPTPPDLELAERPAPPEAWLQSITAEGFRGVGAKATLELKDAAGLTVILGRNGSGKSSFAEAFELLMTGRNTRWDGRPKTWKEGWRNLHHDRRCITAAVRIDGEKGTTRLERDWTTVDTEAPGLDDAYTHAHRSEGAVPFEELGWAEAAGTFRPFLSYNELGSLIDEGPSKLHDALAAILGLDALVARADDLKTRRLAFDRPLKACHEEAKAIRQACLDQLEAQAGEIDADGESSESPPPDGRLQTTSKLLYGKKWDLDAIRSLLDSDDDAPPATGHDDDPGTPHEAVARLAALDVPDSAAYSDALESLRTALETARALAQGPAGQAHRLLAILEPAVAHYDTTHAADATPSEAHKAGETLPCPVCGDTPLDATWRDAAVEQIAALQAQCRELDAARSALTNARAQLPNPPAPATVRAAAPLLTSSDDTETDALEQVATWAAALQGLRDRTDISDPSNLSQLSSPGTTEPSPQTPADPDAPATTLAERIAQLLERATPDLEALEHVLLHAHEAHALREDAWNALRERLLGWLPGARQALDNAPLGARHKAAENWLREQSNALRNERFEPIAAAVLENWRELRAESNVELADIRFEGKTTQRRVDLPVQVDGLDSPALSVMSQGELNALALSLFLPRATLDRSPFRFVVIDDPVQAMDPARVDGLARVLQRTAQTRQVLVFTHDDRLAESVQRLQIPATLLEVERAAGSRVQVRTRLDDVQRAFNEAAALAKTKTLPASARDRVVPGLCRVALEEAAIEAFRRRRLAQGERHLDVQEEIARHDKLIPKVALALFDDAEKAGDVISHLHNSNRSREAKVLAACNKGSHGGVQGADIDFIRRAEQLAAFLRDRA